MAARLPKPVKARAPKSRAAATPAREPATATIIGRRIEEDIVLGRRQPRERLIETIDLLAQKVYGIRSYANAFPEQLDRARRDHLDMIKALRSSRRDDLIALTRRHLKPSPEAYIKAYERRFGKAELIPMQ